MGAEVRVTSWSGAETPSERSLQRIMQDEGLAPYAWSNGPFDKYAPHRHDYDKVIYVVTGSIVFGLPAEGSGIELGPGDRLDLPAGTIHDAAVGAKGVACLEAHSPERRP
jgi:uncharacterized protein YjlB